MALVIGHSHLNSVHEAAEGVGLDLRFMSLWLLATPPILRNEKSLQLHPDVVARLEPVVVSLVGGSAHDIVGLLRHPNAFDFILPEQPHLPLMENATILSYPAIRATIDALIGPDEAELAGLIAATGRRVLHIESPPPCAAHDLFVDETKIIAELWKRSTEFGHDPSPPWLRYKLWRVHSAIVRARCELHGVEFVPTPREALGDDGFLARELYRDPCHANAIYGRMVLRQIGMAP